MNNATTRKVLKRIKGSTNAEIAGMLYEYVSGEAFTYNLSLIRDTLLREVRRRLKGEPQDNYIDNLLVELEEMESKRKLKRRI